MTDEEKNEKAAAFGETERKQQWGKAYTADKRIEALDAEVARIHAQLLKVHTEQVKQEIIRDTAREKEAKLQECIDLLKRPRIAFDEADQVYKQRMTVQRKKMSEYTGGSTFL